MVARIESLSNSAQTFSRLELRGSATTAFWVIISVLRKASMCSALAWFATFCCTQGNVLSFTPVRDQSYSSFVAAAIIWCHLLLSTVTLVTLALVLVPQRFRDKPDEAPTFWFCFAKLVKRTYLQFVGSAVLMGLTVYLLSYGSPRVRAMKLEFYLNCPCSHMYTSYTDLVTRRIGREETVQGLESAQAKVRELPPPQSTIVPAPAGNQPPARPKRMSHGCSSYWVHFVRTSPMTIFVLIAGGYVHAANFIQHRKAQQHFLLFTLGSTLFKLCMQEVAKWITLKKDVKDIRIMCVAIGIPTVLIDTQIRLVLQSVQSNSGTLSGTLFMALIEIAMRLAKVWIVKLEVRRLEVAHASVNAVAPASVVIADTGNLTPSQNEIARKKRKITAFHSAELYSDMAAEYIAIGCSASIVFFFSSHPKYAINAVQSPAGGASESRASGGRPPDQQLIGLSSWHQLVALLLQVGVEIVVDWLSTTLEISGGVDFNDLLKHRAYIAAFFVSLAIINIQSSVTLYAVW